MNEIEIKFLEVDPDNLHKKLLALGAEKIYDEMLEEWIYYREDWFPRRGRVRIRKDTHGIELAYKESTQASSKGNLELEFTISDAEAASEFVLKMGAYLARHQQKRRIHYTLKNISIDIDFWPRIPPMVELEGESIEGLEELAGHLGFDNTKRSELDAHQIYKQVYKVDLEEIKELVFE
jgi:adenylate cyclase class 2